MDELKQIKDTYDKIAADYHKKRLDPKGSTWNNHLEMPAMESVLQPLVSGKKVLDLGCGTGLLTHRIHNWGGRVCGLDISEEMIRIARHSYPSFDFRVGDSSSLPFEDDRFDIVASSLVMHYLRDLKPSFSEISRVLTDDGQFVFSMHHPMNESIDTSQYRKSGAVVLRPYFHQEQYYWTMCGADIVSFHHTFESIIRALKSAGFVLLDMIECRPDQDLKSQFDDFPFASQYPTFCLFHAKR